MWTGHGVVLTAAIAQNTWGELQSSRCILLSQSTQKSGEELKMCSWEDHQLTGDLLPPSNRAVKEGAIAFSPWKSLLPPGPPSFLLSLKPAFFPPSVSRKVSAPIKTETLKSWWKLEIYNCWKCLHVKDCSVQSTSFQNQINHGLKDDLREMTFLHKGSQKRWHHQASGIGDIMSAGTAA